MTKEQATNKATAVTCISLLAAFVWHLCFEDVNLNFYLRSLLTVGPVVFVANQLAYKKIANDA